MTFACSLSTLPPLEELHTAIEAPSEFAQITSSLLRAQLDMAMERPLHTEEQITLSFSNQTSITLSVTAGQTLRQSLQAAQGDVEVTTRPQQKRIEFRFDRVSGEGEYYPTRLILPCSTSLLS